MEIPNALSFKWVKTGNPDEHICKFVGTTKNGVSTIYVGKFEYHTDLAMVAGIDWMIPFAAGTVGRDGKVLSWNSAAYDFDTAQELREPIERLMADNKAVIAENW